MNDWHELLAYLQGMRYDIMIATIIIVFGWFRWNFTSFGITDNSFVFRKGAFFRSQGEIPFSNISAVTADHRLFLRPFRAAYVYIDTNSGNIKRTDLKILMKKKDIDILFNKLPQDVKKDTVRVSYKPGLINMIIYSLVFSSTLSGAIIIAVTFFQSGKIVSEAIQKSLEQTFTDTVSIFQERIAPRISPAAFTIALVIIASWLLSFITNILRYVGFTIVKDSSAIRIKTGIFSKRRYYLNPDKINYADMHQNLLTKIIPAMSVNVNCTGYGKARDELPVFVPVTRKNSVFRALSKFLPDLPLNKNTVKPRRRTFPRYIFPPLAGIIIIFYAKRFLNDVFPQWNDLIALCFVMMLIPTVWLLIVKIFSFFSSGISFEGDNICIRYCKGYAFHTILVKKEKLAKILIKQNIFQQGSKSCDVLFYTNSEYTGYHKVKGLRLSNAEKVIRSKV
jgi:uncharacterized membrane protein YdbT with pleckstrin-like domain